MADNSSARGSGSSGQHMLGPMGDSGARDAETEEVEGGSGGKGPSAFTGSSIKHGADNTASKASPGKMVVAGTRRRHQELKKFLVSKKLPQKARAGAFSQCGGMTPAESAESELQKVPPADTTTTTMADSSSESSDSDLMTF